MQFLKTVSVGLKKNVKHTGNNHQKGKSMQTYPICIYVMSHATERSLVIHFDNRGFFLLRSKFEEYFPTCYDFDQNF